MLYVGKFNHKGGEEELVEPEYLPPTSGYIFKKIFGDPNNLYDTLVDFFKAVITNLQSQELKKMFFTIHMCYQTFRMINLEFWTSWLS